MGYLICRKNYYYCIIATDPSLGFINFTNMCQYYNIDILSIDYNSVIIAGNHFDIKNIKPLCNHVELIKDPFGWNSSVKIDEQYFESLLNN